MAVKRQTAVTGYLPIKQIPPFAFVVHRRFKPSGVLDFVWQYKSLLYLASPPISAYYTADFPAGIAVYAGSLMLIM